MGLAALPASADAAPAHSRAFRARRFLNWFPLGLAYALLYMGRYNLNVAKTALGSLMTTEDFGIIFFFGTLVYGVAFVINGPLTDKIGGRRAMLISVFGSAVSNLLMGWYILDPTGRTNADLRLWFSALYAVNMYFQSFGAVAIVKVNASWFHVRERGGFSGIFGTMISSGIFLAFTVNTWLLEFAALQTATSGLAMAYVVFLVPAALLAAVWLFELFVLKDRPGQAGHADFDTGDASSGEADVPLKSVMVRIFTNPIILTIALIEFCTGVVRQGVMQSYPFYASTALALPSSHFMRGGSWGGGLQVLGAFALAVALFALAYFAKGRRRTLFYSLGGVAFLSPFLSGGWGGLLFVAGVIGSNVAGFVSDWFFQSRRAPAAGGLYGLLFLCTLLMVPAMGTTTTTLADVSTAVSGRVAPGSTVTVDGQPAKVGQDGKYKASVPWRPDQASIPVTVTTPDGATSTEQRAPLGLRPGDRVLEVAGQGNLTDWVDVGRAFAALPPKECLLGASWDAERSMCSIRPGSAAPAALAATTGIIPVLVERDGQRQLLELKDWAVTQRAGEPRVLAARPVATRSPLWLGLMVVVMSLCVIGTHGLLSGTATMDFGGRKGAATAVGMIDGFVYLGTAVQSIALGYLTSRSWSYWPYFLMPFSLVGFLLCLRIWNAKPARKAQPAAPSAPAPDKAPAAARTGTEG